MTLEHNIRRAYIDTLLDGGHTRLADKTINPTEGYIVGGVIEPSTMYDNVSPNPTVHYAQFQCIWHQFDLELDGYTSNLYKAGMGIGTWIHEGKIYFDLVQHLYNLDVATKIAKERGEIAIYDCKNQKDILL
jgi:hypothetical protein